MYFFNSKFSGKLFYIGPKKRDALNKKILRIKPTSNVVRKPRSLYHRSVFKASEYRSMLLYYLPVCLPGCVADVYVKHIRLLSAALHILLKDNISSEEVNKAEEMLHLFVNQHQELFGIEQMVMNVHLLKHLAESVRQLGPLWCHSAFPFERNNGCLLNLINGTSDVLHQMSSKYVLSNSLSKQEQKIHVQPKTLLGKSKPFTETESHVLNISSLKIVNFSNTALSVHQRIMFNKTTYTSLLYTRPKRSIDYFIGLQNGTLGIAQIITLNIMGPHM